VVHIFHTTVIGFKVQAIMHYGGLNLENTEQILKKQGIVVKERMFFANIDKMNGYSRQFAGFWQSYRLVIQRW
jgi:hypothetical protein